jgi:CubicO group peptidase (beta-lactamase class C family)
MTANDADPERVGLSRRALRAIGAAARVHIAAGTLNGAVTLVARGGRIAHLEAHGLMDRDALVPMRRDAIFRMASMTKPVTAVAALILLESQCLRLDDPVSRFIPGFKSMKVATLRRRDDPSAVPQSELVVTDASQEITVRHLLTHTSGLLTHGPGHRMTAELLTPRLGSTLAEYVPRLADAVLDFHPGTKWAYSGLAGPDLLSRIIEIASGLPYDEFLRRRIFDPLAMIDTGFHVPASAGARLVTLYDHTTDGWRRANQQGRFSSDTYFSGAAGLMSTAADYARFAQMLANGGELDGVRLLASESVRLMTSNHAGDLFTGRPGRPLARGYGFGFLVSVLIDPAAARSPLAAGTFGWSGAYGTYMWVDPRAQLVALLMAQEPSAQFEREFDRLVMKAVRQPTAERCKASASEVYA